MFKYLNVWARKKIKKMQNPLRPVKKNAEHVKKNAEPVKKNAEHVQMFKKNI